MGIGKEFMKKTRYQHLSPSDQRKGLPQPPLALAYDKTKTLIDLPRPGKDPAYEYDLCTAIEQRRSVRRYTDEPLTVEALSFLLWCTQGVKEIIDGHATLRTVPSAGARHAFETYVLANRVTGLAPGLYRFLALEHKLLPENLEVGLAERVTAACWDQTFIKQSATTLIWTAIAYRMTWRYSERGYRYLHLDAGHACQNLYLAAQALDAGVCAIAAFDDQALNDLLGIDGEEQFAIYVATVGKKRS